jgi:hypothetical protein
MYRIYNLVIKSSVKHIVTPDFEGKPNANHVRARIRSHVHSDYINDSS